eukprot:TRINITY_DN425_c0_g1_i2.p1 TRINITY_DN425_c0_g1~~TRINITY_DN425_c0_g1_i2.p1  ORF type:complete len:244 (-),score=53.92 TRINITY_DN425_c0_g1_i2:210-941(-)
MVVASPTRAHTTNAGNFPDFRILIVGDSGVGKSSLLSRFADDEMPGEPLGLCGALKVDSKFIRADFGGKQARVQIWDVMGAERQRCVDQYYQEADAVLVVYDVTSQESHNNVRDIWLPDVKQHCRTDVVCGLVANKSDVDMLYRRVTPIDGRELAIDFQVQSFWEASALEGINVNLIFADVSRMIAMVQFEAPAPAPEPAAAAPRTVYVAAPPIIGDSLKAREMASLRDQYTRTERSLSRDRM